MRFYFLCVKEYEKINYIHFSNKKEIIHNKKIMKHYCSLLVAFVICFNLSQLNAQNITVPYSMGFEATGFDSIEIGNWVLNPGDQADACYDKWYVGSSIREAGKQSLYISCDTNRSASFGYRPCTQYAYRDILLPVGTYDLSFDWYCEGSNQSYMAMGLAPVNSTYLVANSSRGIIASQVSAYVMPNSQTHYYASFENHWQNVSLQVQSNGVRAMRLFFVWVNNNIDSTISIIGACIDNLQIASTNCSRPNNIKATVISNDSIYVSWYGYSAEYELQYRKSDSHHWYEYKNIVGGYSAGTIVQGMEEGLYDIRVRGICAPDTSAWAYYSSYSLFYPDLHCINFVDLQDTAIVTCTYGTGYNGYTSNPQVAYQNIGVIDYGSENKLSRHTVNWERTATDPRTGGNLRLIPEGELASVRLGNWDDGSEAESITYLHDVDSSSAILILKYALVLAAPNHTPDEEPRFTIDILDANDNLVNPSCNHCEFYVQTDTQGWESYNSDNYLVTYKPWSSLGLNLEDYIGQTIKIRLTTYDCSQRAHFGYAYFTLDCTTAAITGLKCSSDESVEALLTTPSGFNYQWFDAQGELVSTNQNLVTTSDTTTYRCRLISVENSECYFEVSSHDMYKPIVDFSYQYAPQDCKNIVNFYKSSTFRAICHSDTIDRYVIKCDSFHWEFRGDNSFYETSNLSNPIVEFPAAGGVYTVKLTFVLAGMCPIDTTIQITLPQIKNYYFDIDTSICVGRYISFDDYIIFTEGEYTIPLHSVAGCDSIYTVKLTLNPEYLFMDTINVGNNRVPYAWEGQEITQSGNYRAEYTSALGCDSLYFLHFIVEDYPIYTVNTFADHGNVIGAGSYSGETNITLTVVPDDGFGFNMWSDGTKTNPKNFIVTQDTTFRALFYKDSVEQNVIIDNSYHNSVTISWNYVPHAILYELHIYKNGKSIVTYQIDAENNILNEIFNGPDRLIARRDSAGGSSETLQVEISGLKPGQDYTYSLDAFDDSKLCVGATSGTFTTQQESSDRSVIFNKQRQSGARKVLRDGQLFIELPDGRIYTPIGEEMK